LKREICTEPEGNCAMRVAGPFSAPASSQVTAAGARSVLKMAVPLVRQTSTASRRSSAVIFAR